MGITCNSPRWLPELLLSLSNVHAVYYNMPIYTRPKMISAPRRTSTGWPGRTRPMVERFSSKQRYKHSRPLDGPSSVLTRTETSLFDHIQMSSQTPEDNDPIGKLPLDGPLLSKLMARAQASTQSSCTLPPIFIDFAPCRMYTEDSTTFIASSTNTTKATLPEI